MRKTAPDGFPDTRTETEHRDEMSYPWRQWLAVIAKCKDPHARKYIPDCYLDPLIYKYFKQFYWDIGPPPDEYHIAWMKDPRQGFRIGNLCWMKPTAIKAQKRQANKERFYRERLRVQDQAVSAPEGCSEGGVE